MSDGLGALFSSLASSHTWPPGWRRPRHGLKGTWGSVALGTGGQSWTLTRGLAKPLRCQELNLRLGVALLQRLSWSGLALWVQASTHLSPTAFTRRSMCEPHVGGQGSCLPLPRGVLSCVATSVFPTWGRDDN